MHLAILAVGNRYGLPITRFALEAEARGIESIWFGDHSYIPASRETPWPGGADLPATYYEMLDPFVCMAAAAAVTTSLQVATGVALIVERDPIHVAKQVATLDVLSQGRVHLGVGAGWNLEEMRNHGTDPATRWQLLQERVEAMKAIWATDPAGYDGTLVHVQPVVSRPRPVQPGGPKVHLGGAGPRAYRRALQFADGWMPLLHRGDDDVLKHLAALPAEAQRLGRSLDGFEISICEPPYDLAVLQAYAEAGVHRALMRVTPDNPDLALGELDHIARLAQQLT
jgi:probable F420-dependent oxidoreductase